MASRPVDAMAELQNAFQVLFKNWILALPTAVVSLVIAAFAILIVGATLASMGGAGAVGGFHPSAGALMAGAGGLTFALGGVIIVLLVLLAYATVIAAAENVWRGQPPDLAGGISKALGKLPVLFVLFLIAIVVGIICGILVIAAGLGILLALVLAFLFMYTVPAIVVGNEGVGAALGSSYRLVRENLGPSALAFLGIIVVAIIGQIITSLFHVVPALSVIAAFIIGGFTNAYGALVSVRFYDVLRGSSIASAPRTAP